MAVSLKDISHSSNHKLIVVEGIDGTGKTTAARRLAAAIGAKYLRTPPPPFDFARRYVDQRGSLETRFLFYLSSVAYASDLIRAELAKSDVVCDRYIGSTLAYHRALGINLGWDFTELGLVQPDHAFLLQVSDEKERIKRIRQRGRITASDRLLEDRGLRQKMITEFDKFQWSRIDTTRQSPDEVVALIKSIIRR
jgi:dTMP kinase